MNLTTTTMDKNAARHAYLEYRRALNPDLYEEDRMILKSYRALSQGHQLLNVADAIKQAGANANGSPKLAISRADDEWCYFYRQFSGNLGFAPVQYWNRRNRQFYYPEALPPVQSGLQGVMTGGRSVVPLIPPGLRPKAQLERYHILWEAEWNEVPTDPALLKHLEGDWFAVIAIWDLTEVERIALGMRQVRG